MIMINLMAIDANDRLIGQQLCAVLIAIDNITLKFIKYPLASDGGFADAALVDIEEGFEIDGGETKFTIRKESDLASLQRAGAQLVPFIGRLVTATVCLASGELEIHFDHISVIRLFINAQGFDSYAVHFED
jgi:hypothetical protein